MQIFYFPEVIFWQFFKKFKKLLSRFPVSFFKPCIPFASFGRS